MKFKSRGDDGGAYREEESAYREEEESGWRGRRVLVIFYLLIRVVVP